jgi:flagellar biosynthetic protein FliP
MSAPIRTFIRHYAEMVAAMFAGMIVLGLPLEGALIAAGTSTSDLQDSAPAIVLLGMAITMTVPMVAWMRHRGHGWQPSSEMAASMFLPTFAAIGLMGAGVVGFGTAMGVEHAVMFPAMLGAMLLRPSEYTGHAHHDEQAQAAVQVGVAS